MNKNTRYKKFEDMLWDIKKTSKNHLFRVDFEQRVMSKIYDIKEKTPRFVFFDVLGSAAWNILPYAASLMLALGAAVILSEDVVVHEWLGLVEGDWVTQIWCVL